MKTMLVQLGIGLLTAALIVGGVYAQEPEGVTVTGSRVAKETIGNSTVGAPIEQISLSYRVSYSDLDLATSGGKAALDKRVRVAADAACKEVSRLYPDAKPGDTACAKAAVDAAMVEVRKVEAAAAKNTGK